MPRPGENLARKVLADPSLFPDEFKQWVVRYVQQSPNFQLPVGALPNVEQNRYVGASGEPAFDNGWVAFGAPYEDPFFYKDPFGRVHLGGHMKSGSIGSESFILPKGFRPRNRVIFLGMDGASSAQRVDVTSIGEVLTIAGSNTLFTLNGISFRAY